MSDPGSPEDAVRRYLRYIEDPSTAVDERSVADAEAAFAAATDPIDKLHAAAALERARAADGEAIEQRFVAHAYGYAADEGLPAEAFVALGVPADVLDRAGFPGFTSRGRRSGRGGGRSMPGGRRSPQVPVSAIKTVAMQMPKRFTLAQLADKAGGGSPATIRKAVEELVSEGRAAKLGADPDHVGPGRAPTLYELQ